MTTKVNIIPTGGAEHVHLGHQHPGELGLLPHHQGADGRPKPQWTGQGSGKDTGIVPTDIVSQI